MTEKKQEAAEPTRGTETKPRFFVRPNEGQSADELAEAIADGLIEQINASRLAKCLPPLLKR